MRRLPVEPLRRGLLLLAIVAAGWLAHPAWAGVKAAALLAEMLPGSSFHPLSWWTADPRLEEVHYRAASEEIEADLYLPSAGGRHPAIVVETGVNPEGRRYPALVQLGQSFARAGIACLIPDSPDFLANRATPADVARLDAAYAYVMQRPDVNPDRVGVFGVSVGGDIALLSAVDGHAGSRLRFVATSGQYYSVETMLQVGTTNTYTTAVGIRPFTPDPWVWPVGRNTFVAALPDPGDRDRLIAALADRPPAEPREPEGLTPAGRAMFALLANRDPQRVRPLFQQLPPEVRQSLLALSPAEHVAAIHVPVLIMVDQGDTYIPAEESVRLARALDGRASLTVLQILSHVELAAPDLTAKSLFSFYLPQFFKLWWYAFRVLYALS